MPLDRKTIRKLNFNPKKNPTKQSNTFVPICLFSTYRVDSTDSSFQYRTIIIYPKLLFICFKIHIFAFGNISLNYPLSIASAKELYTNLSQILVKRIAHAEVLLAGRLGNTWGGMIITKN